MFCIVKYIIYLFIVQEKSARFPLRRGLHFFCVSGALHVWVDGTLPPIFLEENDAMRMWMLKPTLLCRKHLLGEHNELHMLAGSICKRKSLDGFIRKKLLEPRNLAWRHSMLAEEMRARGYRHASPLQEYEEALSLYPEYVRTATVDMCAAVADLSARCPDCADRVGTFQRDFYSDYLALFPVPE